MVKQSSISVGNLADHQYAIPLLAQWGFDEWGQLTPGNSLEKTIKRYQQRTVAGSIPETFVALDGEQVVGMASLVENDLASRPYLTPWMASVYVDAQVRGQGVGSQIVQAIMDEARALDVERLYLITHDRMSFYRRLGWTAMERIHYRGEDVTVMSVALIRF